MILIIRFYADIHRMGTLDGFILAKKTFWDSIQGKQWSATDVLGKHSVLEGEIGEEEDWSTKEITKEELNCLEFIFDLDLKKLEETNPNPTITICGFNPINHIIEEEEEEIE